MGASESTTQKKQDQHFRRSTSVGRQSSRNLQLNLISNQIYQTKIDITKFKGSRNDDQYKTLQLTLTTNSKKLQEIKASSKKSTKLECEELLNEIKVALRSLEEKVAKNEEHLDLAAVESNSFVAKRFSDHKESAQKPPKKSGKKTPQNGRFEQIDSIDKMGDAVNNVEKDIKLATQLEDSRQFIFLEKKIQLLYTDLEMIDCDVDTPLHEKKQEMGKRLIRCNNQLRKAKRQLEQQQQQSPQLEMARLQSPSSNISTEKLSSIDEISRCEQELETLEILALTFEGVENEQRYRDLEQKLENQWTKIYTIEEFSDEDKIRKRNATERCKMILKALKTRAQDNEKLDAALSKLKKIDAEVFNLQRDVERFAGEKESQRFVTLDQRAREIWARLSSVEEPNEQVRTTKKKIIENIQRLIKFIYERAEEKEQQTRVDEPVTRKLTRQDATDDEIELSKLLKQAEEFQNHWNQLQHNLEHKRLRKSVQSKSLANIFEKTVEEINRTILDMKEESAEGQNLGSKLSKSLGDGLNVLPQEKENKPTLVITKLTTIDGSKENLQVSSTTQKFGEVQKISAEVAKIKQLIREEGELDYSSIENQLVDYKTSLNQLEFVNSGTVQNSRQKAMKQIMDTLRLLNEKKSQRNNEVSLRKKQDLAHVKRVSTAHMLQQIMTIDSEVQQLLKEAKKFNGITKNSQYIKIEKALLHLAKKLQEVDSSSENVNISRQEIIQTIRDGLGQLSKKLTSNQEEFKSSTDDLSSPGIGDKKQISHEIKLIVEQVQKLKAQIERFNGIYRGILYKQIEHDLHTCSEKLSALDCEANPKFRNAKEQTLQKIQQYLIVLEAKSTQTADQLSSTEEPHPDKKPHEIINDVRNKLTEIKNDIEDFKGSYKDFAYGQIENKLEKCRREILSVNDQQEESIAQAKQQYSKYIDDVLFYFQEKVVSNSNASEDENAMEVLKEAENSLEILKERVEGFLQEGGGRQSNQYRILDESLIKILLTVDNLEVKNEDTLQWKRKLLHDVKEYIKAIEKSSLIEGIAAQEKIQMIMKENFDLGEDVGRLKDDDDGSEYNKLNDRFSKLIASLNEIDTKGDDFLSREKVKVWELINVNLSLLKRRSHNLRNLSVTTKATLV